MNYIKGICEILLIILLIKWLLIMLYCHRQKLKEVDRIDGNNQGNGKVPSNIKVEINTYLYGLVRWSSIQIGMIPSMRIRKILYKYFLAMDINKKTVIYGGCEMRSPWKIKLGNCVVGVSNILDGRYGIVIEDDACLGTGVNIWTLQHDIDDKYFGVSGQGKPVRIKRHAWVCSRSTLLPGVIIGEGAVVASGAIVKHDCDDFGVYAGVPAKKIRNRNTDLEYEVTDHYWHFY